MNKKHASFWYMDDPKIRIAGIAIGHDGRTHVTDAYKKLLTDTVRWATEK